MENNRFITIEVGYLMYEIVKIVVEIFYEKYFHFHFHVLTGTDTS